jgi:hypothetical protein
MSVGSEAKAAGSALKKHWWIFLLIGAGVVVAALWYDHKNSGKLTQKLAGLPGVGKLFA